MQGLRTIRDAESQGWPLTRTSDHCMAQTYVLEPAVSGTGGHGVHALPELGRFPGRDFLRTGQHTTLATAATLLADLPSGWPAFAYGFPPVSAYHAAAYAEGYAAACAEQEKALKGVRQFTEATERYATVHAEQENAMKSVRQFAQAAGSPQPALPVLLGSMGARRQANADKKVRPLHTSFGHREPALGEELLAHRLSDPIDEPAFISGEGLTSGHHTGLGQISVGQRVTHRHRPQQARIPLPR